MLILTRKVDEVIIIELPDGEQIDIVVTEVRGNQISSGVNAPREVLVWREELLS